MKIKKIQWILTAITAGLLTIAITILPRPTAAETVLITGANSGIGLEFTKQYAANGWTVIATYRRSQVPESLAKVTAEFKNVRVERMDVTRQDEIKALATRLKNVAIDVLINNAGVYRYDGETVPW